MRCEGGWIFSFGLVNCRSRFEPERLPGDLDRLLADQHPVRQQPVDAARRRAAAVDNLEPAVGELADDPDWAAFLFEHFDEDTRRLPPGRRAVQTRRIHIPAPTADFSRRG